MWPPNPFGNAPDPSMYTPTGLTTLAPSDVFGSEFDTAMRPALEAALAQAHLQNQSGIEATKALLAHIAGTTNPVPPEVVPAPVNPGMAALAGFFAHINAAQSGSGASPAMVMNALAAHAADIKQTEAANAESNKQFALTKFEQTEKATEAYLNMVKMDAVQQGDLQAAYQAQKSIHKLGETQYKRRAGEAEAAKVRLQQSNNTLIMQRERARAQERQKFQTDFVARRVQTEQALVKLGLKLTPAFAARQRAIEADAQSKKSLILAQMGNIANTMTADEANAALDSIDQARQTQLDSLLSDEQARLNPQGAALPPPPAATNFTVTDPNGKVHTFKNQGEVDKFKKLAGIQ